MELNLDALTMDLDLQLSAHPILSCQDAAEFERRILRSEEEAWVAMKKVGSLLGPEVRSDFSMTGFSCRDWQLLALVGKGHNGGDALLAIGELLKVEGLVSLVQVVASGPLGSFKNNTQRALAEIEQDDRVSVMAPDSELDSAYLEGAESLIRAGAFDVCLDGLLGMQFKPPLREGLRRLVAAANGNRRIRFKVAVDLPSGLGEESDPDAFVPDVTYATGIVKRPLLSNNAGSVRFLDIGFFESPEAGNERVVTDRILDPFRRLRPAAGEKRQYGHLVVLAGSRNMPGALAMSVRAALHSGVGLVTVLAPESLVSQFASVFPEAMWRRWPETPEGSLALEGLWQLRSVQSKASCLLMGPGMGQEAETIALMQEIGKIWEKKVVLDADALRKEVLDTFVSNGNQELIATPHDGEFMRLSGGEDCSAEKVKAFAREKGICLVKKGSGTLISQDGMLLLNTSGNGVLSRGGSGDLLAGLTAGVLASTKGSLLQTAAQAVYWHGRAADLLAQARGQAAVRTTDVVDFFAAALQGGGQCIPSFRANKPSGL